MPSFSKKFQSLPVYPLAHIPARKRALLAAGVDVIDLGAGDADMSAPEVAVDVLREKALDPMMHRYGFGIGYGPFRESVVRYMERRFSVHFDANTEVVPLLGSKEGLAHLAPAFLDQGDVAIVPDPAYAAYMGGVLLSDAEAYTVKLSADNGFLVDLDRIPSDVLERTKMVYLNYPNNPTGAIAPPEYLERVISICRKRDILLVYDNAYTELAFDGYVPPSIFQFEGARDIAIEFHSMSKTFNMTGWRCAWAVAKPEIAGALARIKGFTDTGTFLPIQAASAAALDVSESFIASNMPTFLERRDAAVDAFRNAGFQCSTPVATMYLWIPLPAGIASADFAERLREEHGVVVMPGSGFGAGGEGYFRVSFIQGPDRIREAAKRAGVLLKDMISDLKAVTGPVS